MPLRNIPSSEARHLRAFHRNLIRHGGQYQPEVLTPARLPSASNSKKSNPGGSNTICHNTALGAPWSVITPN